MAPKSASANKDDSKCNLQRHLQPQVPLVHACQLEKEDREVKIKQMIQEAEKKIEKEFYSDYLERNNSLFIMLDSKAKGNERQIKNSTALQGQNFICSERQAKVKKFFFRSNFIITCSIG